MSPQWENLISSPLQNARMTLFLFILFEEILEHSTSTVLCPFAWQPAYLNVLLFCVCVCFPPPVKRFVEWATENFKPTLETPDCELSTALLTEGIKKINCCGLQEIKLYVSVEGEWPMEGIWSTPAEPAAFLGTWSNSHHTSFPFGRVLLFTPTVP